MLKAGWVVKRAPPEGPPQDQEASSSGAPVLVHRCNDERTLTAAAGRLGRSPNGEPCLPTHCGSLVVFLMAEDRLWFVEYSSVLVLFRFAFDFYVPGRAKVVYTNNQTGDVQVLH